MAVKMKEKEPGFLVLSCKHLNMDKQHLHPPHGLCSGDMLAHQTCAGCFQGTSSPRTQAVAPFPLLWDPSSNPPGLSKATHLWLSCPWTRDLSAHHRDLPSLSAVPWSRALGSWERQDWFPVFISSSPLQEALPSFFRWKTIILCHMK